MKSSVFLPSFTMACCFFLAPALQRAISLFPGSPDLARCFNYTFPLLPKLRWTFKSQDFLTTTVFMLFIFSVLEGSRSNTPSADEESYPVQVIAMKSYIIKEELAEGIRCKLLDSSALDDFSGISVIFANKVFYIPKRKRGRVIRVLSLPISK